MAVWFPHSFMKFLPLCFIMFSLSVHAQNLRKQLPAHNWHLRGSITGRSIELTKIKPDTFDYTVNFSRTGKVILRSSKNQGIDSTLKFIAKKRSLNLTVSKNDSLFSYEYSGCFENDGNNVILCRLDTAEFRGPDRHSARDKGFFLTRETKSRYVRRSDELLVQTKTDQTDSSTLSTRTSGQYFLVKNDSLFLDPDGFALEYYFLLHRDTLAPSLQKIALKDIYKISHERTNFNSLTGLGMGLSILSTLIVSPLVSFSKEGFNSDKYIKVAGYSLASTAFFATLRISFSHKTMRIGKCRKCWQLQYY